VVPAFYYLSIYKKEKRFPYDHSARRSFEQNLEFYPVTRRAWNRAVAIREQELLPAQQPREEDAAAD